MKTELNKNEKLSTEQETQPIANVLLPAVFSSVDEVVTMLKLDRRHKWEEL
jgi:hypothetical protein